MTRGELQQQIETAFADAAAPDPENLIEHHCANCEELKRAFSGHRWQDVPRETVLAHYGSLSLFTAEAYCAYLPAYLVEALSGDGSPHSEFVYDYTVLSLSASDEFQERRQRRIRLMTPAQIDAVIAFLEFITADEESEFSSAARTALEEVWYTARGSPDPR